MTTTRTIVVNTLVLALASIRIIAAPMAPFSDVAVRAAAVRAFTEQSQHNQAVAVAWAQQQGLPVRYDVNGVTRELMRLDVEGRPLYYSTANVNAAISTAANILRDSTSYLLPGNSVTVGVWDAGSVLSTHQEFGGRARVMDGAASHWHSTHVGGTIAASGVDANARGMAPSSRIHSYDWNTDTAEMAARGASAPGQGNKLYLSNHSYGLDGGWYNDGGWHWRYGLGTLQDPAFGQYDDNARNVDTVVYGAPYYLPMFCGMNSRSDGPANGDTFYYWNGGGYSAATYNAATHPLGDGVYKGGYDTLAWHALAKNCLTVGAVNDAVGLWFGFPFRSPAAGTMSAFSNWGPTDDGRIKPDVVGNGVSLYSTHNAGNAAYATASGTSMATPNVCGTAAQLLEYFRRFGNEPRASTMKALLIHTADDLGTAGPDYAFGWGLVNGVAAADLIAGDHRGMGVTHMREVLRNNADAPVTYTYTSAGTAPFKATLCWTDPPGSATAGDDDRTKKLVNDLDLRVIDPAATTHYPFRLDYNNPGAAATRADNSIDNVEQVLISAPVAGTYTVRVSHFGALSSGSQYFSLIVTSEAYPLAAPSGINASDGTYSFYVRVTWGAVPGATTYKVYRNTVNSSSTATLLTTVSGTAVNDASAVHGTVYYYWVKSVSTLSDSSFSGSNSGFLEPSSPTGLAASDGAFLNQVELTWNAVGGASSYDIYRSQDSAPGTSVLLGNSATTSYLDTAVTPGTTYWYWVKTVMSGVSSYYSNGDSGFLEPVAPTGLTASDGAFLNQVELTWSAVAGAASYDIYRSQDSAPGTSVLLGSSATTSYLDTAATPGTTYWYWVKTVMSGVSSDYSSGDSGFLKPMAPNSLAASDGAFLNQVELTWNAVGGASSYDIYRSQDSAPGTSVLLGSSATPSYLDPAATPGTTYWYWVKTVMSGVSSYYSSGNNGYALLTLTCPLWKAHQAKKNSTIKGKETTPALEALLAQGWQVGIAAVSGNAATPHAGPYLLTPNKKHTIWKFKAKKNATVNYAVRKHVFKATVWTNLPPTWVIYARP